MTSTEIAVETEWWHDYNYAAAVHAVAAIQLAGGTQYDAWPIAAWYVRCTGRSVTCIETELGWLWRDTDVGAGP